MFFEGIDILDLEYSSRGRDIDIVEPTLSYLEIKYKLRVKRKWLFRYCIVDILLTRPKILIVANGVGSIRHVRAVRFASLLGIKVVTFVSEGDYSSFNSEADTNIFSECFFGDNHERIFFEDLHLEWSQRNINSILKNIPESSIGKTLIKLSGATGFDKYKLLKNFLDKEIFLARYNRRQYRKIVVIAGWAFGNFFPEYDYEIISRLYSLEERNCLRDSLELVKQGYRHIIENNPDILFVLKSHPMEDKKYSEFDDIKNYCNVIYIFTEENIYDLINICDIWVAFESTTCLEAWLFNKTTVLYNPVISNFRRSVISKGSPNVSNPIELDECIKSYFRDGYLKIFDDLLDVRKKIVEGIIGFDDGKCYMRAAEYIWQLYNDKEKKISRSNIREINRFLYIGFKEFIKYYIYKFRLYKIFPRYEEDYLDGLWNEEERLRNKKIYQKAIEDN